MIEIVLASKNIVAWELGENGINPMYMIFYSLNVNWEIAMKLEHDILVWTFKNVDMIYEDHGIDNVIWNLNLKPRKFMWNLLLEIDKGGCT